jgi:putative FmdB family regulatory protein
MPTHDYVCECGHREERKHGMRDVLPDRVTCPTCGRDTLTRQIGGGSAVKVDHWEPYESSRLPRDKHNKKVVVGSRSQERDIMAGSLTNGQDRYERE